MIRFREGRRGDVPAVVALLADDDHGAMRETAETGCYFAAFDAMQEEGTNLLIVGEDEDGRIVATYQLTFITGLSLRATRRAQVESVRVAADRRGAGIGAAMMADAEARAREAGCRLMQLTSNAARDRAIRFYESCGFTPSHVGFKRPID